MEGVTLAKITNDDGTRAQSAWHLDKSISVSMMFAIFGQLGLFVWYASKMDSRVDALERTDARVQSVIESRMKLTDERFDTLNRERDRVIRIETQMGFIVEAIKRIENKLDAKEAR